MKSWWKNAELVEFIRSVDRLIKNLPLKKPSIIEKPFVDEVATKVAPKPKSLCCFSFEFDEKIFNQFKQIENIFTSGYIEPKINISEFFNQSLNYNSKQMFPKFKSNSTIECNVEKYFLKQLEESWNSYTPTTSFCLKKPEEILEFFKNTLQQYSQLSNSLWNIIIYCMFKIDTVSRALIKAELWPRVCPINILKWLLGNIEFHLKIDSRLLDTFGAIAVVWSLEQRMMRCISFIKAGDSMKIFLQKELIENRPHENWSPREHPQWLIFEIEQNTMIRKIQIDVTMKMLHPPENQNTVMQLNMGEGKTSVIIPLLVTASNIKAIMRIVVLKSLFNMNYSSLCQKLGGILNKRVYIFPCQRDIDFNESRIKLYKDLYAECIQNKGIIISLPEYQLSFKLKGLEVSRSGNNKSLSEMLIDTQCWLDNNVRDILDESDELLHFKYQLVYPVGNNTSLESLRWLVAQAVLNISKQHFEDLKAKYNDSIEYHVNKDFPQAFPKFRLIDDKPYKDLCEKICLDILKGKALEINFMELRKSEIEHVKNYVLCQQVDDLSRKTTDKILNENPTQKTILLILRAYFAHGILQNVLSKRWKVEYGINFMRNDLLQAVPYRAKDVPAERAQFAHQDIVILLTQLSYFYSGLNDSQLDETFNKLSKRPDASAEYSNWI